MGHTQALEDKDLNQTDIMNELFVSFISFYAVAFTEFADNLESENLAAWSVSVLICLMLAINLF